MRTHTKMNKWFRWFIVGIRAGVGAVASPRAHGPQPVDDDPGMLGRGDQGVPGLLEDV